MSDGVEGSDNLMIAVGSLEGSAEELEEVYGDCEEKEEVIVGFIVWLGGFLRKISIK